MNNNFFVVFDLETDSPNPEVCSPIQIAALVIHPRRLEILDGSEFCSWVKPDDFGKDYYENHKDTIDWHANNHEISPEEFLKKLEQAPPEKIVWNNFITYLKSWYVEGKNRSRYNAPILAGYNIFEFDKIIIDRLCRKYKNVDKDNFPNIYQKRDTVDIMKLVFAWNESLTFLNSFKMDELREKLFSEEEKKKMYSGVAHEGLKDCYDEAALLIKYLNLHRRCAINVKGWK
jgi:DNA polymerase III epsilon subunit-like protein